MHIPDQADLYRGQIISDSSGVWRSYELDRDVIALACWQLPNRHFLVTPIRNLDCLSDQHVLTPHGAAVVGLAEEGSLLTGEQIELADTVRVGRVGRLRERALEDILWHNRRYIRDADNLTRERARMGRPDYSIGR